MILLPAEQVVAVMLLFSLALFLWFGEPLRDPYFLYVSQILAACQAYPLALFFCFVVVFALDGFRNKRAGKPPAESESWDHFRRLFLNRASIVRDLRLINAVILMFVAFAHMKHLIPRINPILFDEPIFNFEKSLLGGLSAPELLQNFFGTSTAEFWSQCYTLWYGYMVSVVFIMILQRNYKLGDEYCAAFCMMWFLGMLWVYLMPTWGPCFFRPDTISALPHTAVTYLQADLWQMKLALDGGSANPKDIFAISGVPSLHIAVAFLGSVYLARVSRLLGMLSWIFFALTFGSTIYLGWHYLIDNIAAILLALVCLWLANRAIRTPRACA